MPSQKVVLRDEREGKDSRHLVAYLDDQGNLHLDGQDLGPGTAHVSDDGEYEWFTTYAARDLGAVVAALGGTPGQPLLELLGRFTGVASYDLERRLRDAKVPHDLQVWR